MPELTGNAAQISVAVTVKYLDALQGYADGSASSECGENTIKALGREIGKLPRYRLVPPDGRQSLAAAFSS
jgi:hypothetical protein